MENEQVLAAAAFIIKLMRERNDEAKVLIKAGALDDARVLLNEVDLLSNAFELMGISKRI